MILSHDYWLRRFGGGPSVLDQTMTVNGHPLTIVGVAAPGFSGLQKQSAAADTCSSRFVSRG